MPKKKTLWKRETPCISCETQMVNYQFMTKSQSIEYDEWLVTHYTPIGEYDVYPETLKTTICPGCLMASNEYSFGVDNYAYFSRNVRKNDLTKEFIQQHVEDRFKTLCEAFEEFQHECAVLDKKNNRPPNTRTPATFQKIWSDKEKYAVPFFNLVFQDPRDLATTLCCFTMDRYCQMLRIAFSYDVEPEGWDFAKLKEALVDKFRNEPLDMKQPEPRFYYITSNYLQSIQFLEQLIEQLGGKTAERHEERLKDYWKNAHEFLELSMGNDDLSAVPVETKDGGINLLMAKLHFKFGSGDLGKKCLRFAKNYADNRMKQISSKNQQNFVNEVETLYKTHFEAEEEEEGEAVQS